jgi:D-alanine-D-alanine ligase
MKRDRPAVLILHQAPPEGPGAKVAWLESDAGVLGEAMAVAAALDRLGLNHRTVGVSRLTDLRAILADAPEEVVFNLVESFPSRPSDAPAAPALYRAFGKGYTGADAACLVLAQDKWQTKAVLRAAGLPCPAGVVVPVGERLVKARLSKGPYMVKPASLDASEGIDHASVVAKAGPALRRAVRRVHRDFGQPALVEQFVDGRELNASLLERRGKVKVLPLAEIDFSAFPAGKPRIVDYAAKWLPESFAYRHTPRVIPARLTARQANLVRRLARRAWTVTGCRGYARIDIRLDRRGRPLILEVNPNPDITPDDGFPAALAAAGIPYEKFIEAAVRDACESPGTGLPARRAERPRQALLCFQRIRWAEPRDRDAILGFVAATGFFRDDEVAVARELLDDALAKGPGGHYQSFVAEDEGGTAVGWVCFGPTPCAVGTFDIYWIVVAPPQQGRGVGAVLMTFAERRIADRGGRLAVVETSGRPVYKPTRQFYTKMGYCEAAIISDFYSTGDAKLVYTKPV